MILRSIFLFLYDILKSPKDKYLRICFAWLVCHSIIMFYVASIAHHTNSLSLKTYGHLIFFDIMRIITLLVSGWCRKQKSSLSYTYGYDRYEIVSVFVTVILTQFASFFTLKDCFERFISLFEDSPHSAHDSHSSFLDIKDNRFNICLLFGFLSQLIVTYGLRFFHSSNRNPFDKTISFCGTNHLQLQLIDIYQNICNYLPSFMQKYVSPHIILNRQTGVLYKENSKDNPNSTFNINDPFNILNSLSAITLYVIFKFCYSHPSQMVFLKPLGPEETLTTIPLSVTPHRININNSIMDLICCTFILLAIFITLFPIAKSTAKILLQTLCPDYTIGQLDRCLREASILDGVLELTNEHFWVLSFGHTVGTVKVRCKRDADEQLVAAHVTDKLSPMVTDLTVEIVKDSYARRNF